MPDRDKDVMVYHYDPRRKFYLVTLHLENKPGAFGNLANLLAVRGMNLLEGYFGSISDGPTGTASFFVETTNLKMDERWLKEFIETSVYASDVEVRGGVEGFLSDSLNFPLRWNNGDRAVLMRVEGLRKMLMEAAGAFPGAGEEFIYNQGFSYGKSAWENLMSVHRPATKDGLAEMLSIYSSTGWGRPQLSRLDAGKLRATVRMEDCFECSVLSTGRPSSHFVRGHLAGAFSAYFRSDVKGAETRCVSKGDPSCEFEISP
jgi:predicted hydrocarbon binding protein